VVRGTLALLVTGVALWWSFKDVHFDVVVPRLKQSAPGAMLLFAFVLVFTHFVRVLRWGLLVKPLGPTTNRDILAAGTVGIPATFFVPLRLGEFVRPLMIARSGVPFAGGLASVVVERIVDGLTNVGLFFTLLAFLPGAVEMPETVRVGSRIALALFGGGCVVLVAITLVQDPAIRLVSRLLSVISERLANKVETLLRHFIVGLKPLGTPVRLVSFLALTLVYWGSMGFAITYVIGSYGIEVPWLAGPFTMSVLVFAIMIPAGPAFAGTMEAGFKAALVPFGVTADEAAVVALAIHLIHIVVFALLLGLGFAIGGPNVARRAEDESGLEPEAHGGP